MIKAVFADFYGTLVHEDGEIVREVLQEILKSAPDEDAGEIGAYWSREFRSLYTNSCGETFRTQRELEYESIERTVRRFRSSADAAELSERMFAQWRKPPIFEDAKPFLEQCPAPVYIASNIDRADVLAAIAYHGLTPAGVFTSEDARSYKPRKELFKLALEKTGHQPEEVVHIGDSLGSDVNGAAAAGIRAVWLNRRGRDIPDSVTAVRSLTELISCIK